MTDANPQGPLPLVASAQPATGRRRIARGVLAATATAALLAASTAVSGAPYESFVEHQLRMASEPNEYFFFEDDRKQVVDYKRDRIVRICAGDSRHLVPLEVTHDDDTTMVHRNDCVRVEAKEIYLEPAERLETNAVIQATVRTER
ncbi:MAG TPA: hypothetical protein RMH99_24375 [Sandaracinaceae bacterium LLY-WYZ-13_1]|nr:hypothetical protein [Sandaracinaceae bacterium LLY-WYZ-13_1]